MRDDTLNLLGRRRPCTRQEYLRWIKWRSCDKYALYCQYTNKPAFEKAIRQRDRLKVPQGFASWDEADRAIIAWENCDE